MPTVHVRQLLAYGREFPATDTLGRIRTPADRDHPTGRLDSGKVARNPPPIRWLRHDRPFDDHARFRREMGHPIGEVERPRRQARLNVSRVRADRPGHHFLTPEREPLDQHRERTSLRLFPDLDP